MEKKSSLFQYLIVLFLFQLLSVQYFFANSALSINDDTKLFINEKSYFSINLPSNWNTLVINDSTSTLHLISKSPDTNQSIFIYVFESNNEIDLKKFADSDTKLFSKLGQLTNTKKNNDYYVIPKNIVKSYKSNSLNTKILFQVKDNLGYILLWSSTDNDDTIFSESLNTFKINIPFSKTIKSWFSGILGWVVGIVILLLSLGVLFLIGKTGTIMRKGIEIKKAIKIAVKENPHKGLNFDNHILKLNRKSAFMIILPLLGWIIIYVCVFVLFSTKIFLLSLLGLIPVILGFFGIFFTPDLDDLF